MLNSAQKQELLTGPVEELFKFLLINSIELLGHANEAQDFYLRLLEIQSSSKDAVSVERALEPVSLLEYKKESIIILEEKILKRYELQIRPDVAKKSVEAGEGKLKPYYFNQKGEVEDLFSTAYSALANGHLELVKRICNNELGLALTLKERYDVVYHAWRIARMPIGIDNRKFIIYTGDEKKNDLILKSIEEVLFNFGEENLASRFTFYEDVINNLSNRSEGANLCFMLDKLYTHEPQWREHKKFFKKVVYTLVNENLLTQLQNIETEDLSVIGEIEALQEEFKSKDLTLKVSPEIHDWMGVMRQKQEITNGLSANLKPGNPLKI